MSYDYNSSSTSETKEYSSKSENKSISLSEAASIMRNKNATPEQRKQAAAMLGRQGGLHSHDRDPGRTNQKTKKLEDA